MQSNLPHHNQPQHSQGLLNGHNNFAAHNQNNIAEKR